MKMCVLHGNRVQEIHGSRDVLRYAHALALALRLETTSLFTLSL